MSERPSDVARLAATGRFADAVGYSRAVRAGKLVFVAGTTGTGPDGEVVAPGDAHAQTAQALQNVRIALEAVGARLEVVQTRIYVRDISRWEEVGRAHAEVFADARPATAMVEVCGLIDPAMLVEVEAVAVVGSSR